MPDDDDPAATDDHEPEPTETRSVEDDPDAIPDDGMAPLITNTGGDDGIGDSADAASG